MKILWMSDSPGAPSGLGNVTRAVCSRLGELGHSVGIIGWQHRGRPLRLRYYTVYGVANETDEPRLLRKYLRQLRPDILVTFADSWRISYVAQSLIADCMKAIGTQWWFYCPIDSDMGQNRLPPDLVDLLSQVDAPIAMSRYGQDLMSSHGLRSICIPHGVNTTLFRPPANKERAKGALGYDGRFVILSDARNQIRKMLPRLLEIFRRFAADKSDVTLHLQCDPYDSAASSPRYNYDLLSDIEFLGLNAKVRFSRDVFKNRGMSLGRLATLYQAADVHFLASCGEGFGLPTLQAAAAGVVPLAPAHSASRELIASHGERLRVQHFVRDQVGLRRALVDIDDAVAKLERLYADRSLLRSKAQAARRFAEEYAWERVMRQWQDLLQSRVSSSLGKVGRRRLATQRHAPQARTVAKRRGPPFTIPVTFREVAGRIYLAGPADLSSFRRLRRIFPNLSAWSDSPLVLRGQSKRYAAFPFTLVSAGSVEFLSYLASSNFALDLAGTKPALALLAVAAGVPLVRLDRFAPQKELRPQVMLAKQDTRRAVDLGRRLLCDHEYVASVRLQARKLRGVSERKERSKEKIRRRRDRAFTW